MRHLAFLALLLTGIPLHAQRPGWQDPPRLIVGVVVDQMRTDHLYRYWHNFGEGGFKRLVGNGAFLRDAHFNYQPTRTGPGHASIYTGTTPTHHGIVGNNMYVRATGQGLYCAQDDRARCVGDEAHPGKRSPANLFSTTLADELERFTAGRSKTIGVAWKDRGSILPIGRMGDAAYWFGEGLAGHWVTSDWYMDELPRWVKDFNAQGLAAKYMQGSWDLVLPMERYAQVLPDDNPYEIPIPGTATATLPVDLAALLAANGGDTKVLRYLPVGNRLTTDFALAALDAEAMGRDAITDLLAISYGAPDELGHLTGIRALEMEDMYIRLDRELERLLNALDKAVGPEHYTLFLTSDHGAVDVPAYMKDLKGSADYIDTKLIAQDLDISLSRRFGQGKWVRHIVEEQIFLNDSLIAARKLDRAVVQQAAADELLRNPLVAEALTASDLSRFNYSEQVRGNMQRGFMPLRGGDVMVAWRPGHMDPKTWARGRGTDHGSPWNYDSHVPIVFYGKGIRPGEVLRRTHITDIASTIAMIAGIPMPDAATGHVVTEVLR
ncbi:MAG: alkaline phosphatase family protein [Flavobacteriales bacterium]|nr:alkaline phosphatase family protein [Flavobacteriales bacterium]